MISIDNNKILVCCEYCGKEEYFGTTDDKMVFLDMNFGNVKCIVQDVRKILLEDDNKNWLFDFDDWYAYCPECFEKYKDDKDFVEFVEAFESHKKAKEKNKKYY